MRPTPDFFIAGAPKCGTTSLWNYLRAHQRCSCPLTRSQTTFAAICLRIYVLAPSREYEALFAAAPPHALLGEASVFYLYSKVAIGQIMAHNVNARIIVMLRNPVEATRSMHSFR